MRHLLEALRTRLRTLAAGLLLPVPGDATLAHPKRSNLDRLCQRITNALGNLVPAVGLKFSSPFNENKSS